MTWLLLVLLSGHTDWTSFRTSPTEVLNGMFTSCPDSDEGSYGERVYVYAPHNVPKAEIHLGPRDAFGVFVGVVPEEREHDTKENLLWPAFHFNDVDSLTGRNWAIPRVGLHVSVQRLPGSFDECYSWNVLVTELPKYKLAER